MEGAFKDRESLSHLTCLSVVPPEITDTSFNEKIFSEENPPRLHVPVGTYDLYANAPGWRRFWIIDEEEYNPTALQTRHYDMVLNGINGDIQVFIEEEPNDTFIRDGNNLLYNLLLDFPTAALGGTVDIPTIEGNTVKIKIEPGTQPGKTLRLRDKGLDPVRGYGNEKGDLIVNISVYVPKTLSKEEKKAVEQFKESDNFKGDSQTKRSIFERFKNYFN